jgi:hypothetical protein
MAGYQFKDKYVRVRMRRFFEGQFKHVFIGRVIAETPSCLVLYARSFHFRKIIGTSRATGALVKEADGLTMEDVAERAVPWASIEFVQILGDQVNYDAPVVWSKEGNVVLDDKVKTLVTVSRDHGE